MFAILQSLQGLQGLRNLTKIEIPPAKIINKSHDIYERKNDVSDKTRLYIKDSLKKSIEKIEENNSRKSPNIYNDLSFSLQKCENNIYLYAVNSVFFFSLGAFTFSRWYRK